MESLYRRPLPDPFIPFSSAEGRKIFREALDAGTLECFFPLSEQFHTQSDPAFCGLSSLVVALNALGVDPGRLWKGPWRWFGEELLDCCAPLDTVRDTGLTLLQLACLARCNGATTTVQYADQSSVDALRDEVLNASRKESGVVLLAAYSREVLGQTGNGHFSPLGGYHAGKDLVLVLDVARFKYPAHWAPLPMLHRAMRARDPVSDQARGWLTLRALGRPSSLAYFVSCRGAGWMDLLSKLFAEAPRLLAAAAPGSAAEALASFGQVCLSAGLASVVELRDTANAQHAALAQEMREALRATHVYKELEGTLRDERTEIAAIFALAAPTNVWAGLSAAPKQELMCWLEEASTVPVLAPEISHVRTQIEELRRVLAIEW